MSKRQRFIFTSIVLSLGFFGIQFFGGNYRIISILVLGVITLGLFAWSLSEGLGINTTLITLLLPLAFTVGVGLFWFLLPYNIFTRIPIVIVYGLGIYALCLTANIYTVSAIRTIALLRAARGVGFVLTLFTFFLIYDAILSIHSNIIINTLLVAASSFPLFLQGFWVVTLDKNLSAKIVWISAIANLIMGEIAASLFFWPVTVIVGSLFFTVAVYVLLGLGQAQLEGRLFRQTAREYLLVGAVVFIAMFLSTRWGG